ncbi:MAG TPA: hypothetical protein GXX41_02045 [Thermoanaerobacterium sp.]|nr:hypothetical protein [Thermoanaerobacterium sp.]
MNLFQFPASDMDFIFSEQNKPVQINGIDGNAILNIAKNYIITLTPVKTGDIIEYNQKKYLITTENNEIRYNKYYKAKIEYCNYSIKFKIQSEVKEFDAIIDSKTFDVQSNQYIELPSGKIIVKIQDNSDSENIVLGNRFIKMGSAWKITGIDKTTKGIISLICDLDQFNTSDDIENEIADAFLNHTYEIIINNGDALNMNVNDTVQLNVTCKDNNAVVSNPVVTYSTNNTSIATVSNSGLVTAIGSGSAIITVTYQNVSDTITINVASATRPMAIVGSDTLNSGYNQTYTIKYTDTNTTVTDKTFNFSLSNSNASIVSKTSNSVTLQYKADGTVVLTAICNEDASMKLTKNITCSGNLW